CALGLGFTWVVTLDVW
nr:immunoglobulin heavy chain junction region [Macaca mulatta]MOY22633.1 immunoglobulin heavy chain junction region [Macaca mulatta]MOY25561.1 immunoglobulin heavy chain junction region [Macaca mulatta]MOY28072.1 immunoglobulin heavy chain junction region [Macaca mulatta]MOY28109.1 immunoglobulin heavy chain junction region [Macaca mulatta]